MKKVLAVMCVLTLIAFTFGCKKAEPPKSAEAPVAGGAVVGVTVTEIVNVAKGWSVEKHIMGHDVYNDKNEKVGKVYDIIIAPDKAFSYMIISSGGFLGVDKHDVAIPANQVKMQDGKIVLPGATKDAIKAMPEFQYSK
jgi:sporulation protein YlmC with PRC-barrel domain